MMEDRIGPGHVLIVVVSHTRNPDAATLQAIQMDIPPLVASGWQVAQAMHIGDADLAGARNLVHQSFREQSMLTDLVCVDSDVSWEPGALGRLLSHRVELVLGAYPRRFDGGGYAVSLLREGSRLVNPVTGAPDADGLLEVMGGPAGLMRISRSGAERMVAAYSDRWYRDARSPNGQALNLFEFSVSENERTTEDIHYCNLFRQAGGRVWVDPHLLLHHHGTKTYSGRYIEFLVDQKK